MIETGTPVYLRPYVESTRRHAGGFGSLLWASPYTQHLRFDAIARAFDFTGRFMLDAGCGRADLLPFLLDRGIVPARYVCVEAMPILADRAKRNADEILEIDFATDRSAFDLEPDAIVFSGSLNTFDSISFWALLERAFRAAREAVVFNCLISPELAAGSHLIWHDRSELVRRAKSIAPRVRFIDDYLEGDATVVLEKSR